MSKSSAGSVILMTAFILFVLIIATFIDTKHTLHKAQIAFYNKATELMEHFNKHMKENEE